MIAISGGRALALGMSVVALGVGGCGSGGDLGPPPLVLDKAPTENGDQQSGLLGVALEHNLRVIVTRDGAPEAGVSVTWSVVVGSVTPLTAATGVDGISAATWTLGRVAGAQTAQAVVSGATGSPVTFTATATVNNPLPPPTPPPPPPPPPLSALVLAKAPTESGDAQTGPVGASLGKDLRVIVTRDGLSSQASR
jgi:hypothetical protein